MRSSPMTPTLRTSGLPLPLPSDLDALARDYTRLFGGLLPGYGLEPPFASVWRGERQVMGEATWEVMAACAEAGGHLVEAAGLPPDHIGLELSFPACLMQSRDEALEQGIRRPYRRTPLPKRPFSTTMCSSGFPTSARGRRGRRPGRVLRRPGSPAIRFPDDPLRRPIIT